MSRTGIGHLHQPLELLQLQPHGNLMAVEEMEGPLKLDARLLTIEGVIAADASGAQGYERILVPADRTDRVQ